MTIGRTLFGEDLVKTAIARLRLYEGLALQRDPEGYYVAFSGGKDSIVIRQLCQEAGVKHRCYFHVTTVDPPELLRFIRAQYPDTVWTRPAETMWQLIRRKLMPPTFRKRYCCEVLKEYGGIGRVVVMGLRWQESSKRRSRRMIESCYKPSVNRLLLSPIIDWTTNQVWSYIRDRKLAYPSLYDEGFRRIGCVGCPMGGVDNQKKEFARWPRFEALYRRAFDHVAKVRAEKGLTEEGSAWATGESMFNWWLSKEGRKGKQTRNEPWLFGG